MRDILIIGGGIAGIEAAIYYRKEGFNVELISERDYTFIYPIAIWIPVGKNDFKDVAFPVNAIALQHRFTFTVDRVCAISAADKTVTLEEGGIRSAKHLVIALGSNKMKHAGIEHTLSICGVPEQSVLLKEQIDALIQRGSGKIAFGFGGNPVDSSAMRGGPAFELFFNLHHLLVKRGIRKHFEMTFFAPMPKPGARMGDKALDLINTLFHRNKFMTRYGQKIIRFEANEVIFEDESRLESDLIMFIPAGDAHPLIKESDLPLSSGGFIRINDYCEIEAVNGWYAIGDSAALEGPEWKAKQGHVAEVMARNAAHNNAITLGLKMGTKKGYKEHLTILCLMDMGNGAGLVYRNATKALLIPLPIIGHWLKIGWGWYYKMSKMGYIPRIPGM